MGGKTKRLIASSLGKRIDPQQQFEKVLNYWKKDGYVP
jgi:hypothetical protein